jgi:hypothetical protein
MTETQKGGFMKSRTLFNAMAMFAALAITLLLAVSALSQNAETVPYTFPGGSHGAIGATQLVSDTAGNLYGTTLSGGNNSTKCEIYTGAPGCGVAFKLTPGAHGSWKETVLYTFTGGKDGAIPVGGVIFDSAGNLLGTAFVGGNTTSQKCIENVGVGLPPGCGVVFKLTPRAHGPWEEEVLYTFTGGSDGARPWSRLILDSHGNVYGTAINGGNTTSCSNQFGCGVVFKLRSAAKGSWKESVLYTFGGGSDGYLPYGGPTFDSRGNLYGVTYVGGDPSCSSFGSPTCGVVFKLTPTRSGPWTETVLHAFTGGSDGSIPLFYVILDSDGNVYGTTIYGGNTSAKNCLGGEGFDAPPGCGVVFKLAPRAHGTWEETVLYSFTGGTDGAFDLAPLIFDSSGNLYGMTGSGGDLAGPCTFGTEQNAGCGVVFKLKPARKGPWSEKVLYAFTGGADGSSPESNLLFDSAGNIFGITEAGGNTSKCTGNFSGLGCGVVFKIDQGHRDQFEAPE